jgi:hypothetical protein
VRDYLSCMIKQFKYNSGMSRHFLVS